MGRPILIADVAEMMAKRSGKNIRIVYTGLRPGEKVHEVLFADGEVDTRPLHPSISHSSVPCMGDWTPVTPPADTGLARQMLATMAIGTVGSTAGSAAVRAG
jgi:hypothetical protein